jgi:protein-tyrosine kinase
MLRADSDLAGTQAADSDAPTNPSMHRSERGVSAQVFYPSVAIADGLWHQAQTIYGVIFRARTKSSKSLRTVGLTSCYDGEGVSTVSAILALAAACQSKVALIDANLPDPSVHRRFRVQTAPGMLQAIAGQPLENCIQTSPLGVSVVTAGCEKGPVTTYLRPDLLLPVFNGLNSDFDLLVIDLPATSADSLAYDLSSILDGIVLVVESERVNRQAAQRTISCLQQSGANLLGAVFNKRRDYTPGWLYRML